MKIATYNVNGINGRLPVLLRWLEEAQPDVVCLQELKASDDKFPIAAIKNAGYGAVWHGQKSWNGVAILARGGDPIEKPDGDYRASGRRAQPFLGSGSRRDPRWVSLLAKWESGTGAEVRIQAPMVAAFSQTCGGRSNFGIPRLRSAWNSNFRLIRCAQSAAK